MLPWSLRRQCDPADTPILDFPPVGPGVNFHCFKLVLCCGSPGEGRLLSPRPGTCLRIPQGRSSLASASPVLKTLDSHRKLYFS